MPASAFFRIFVVRMSSWTGCSPWVETVSFLGFGTGSVMSLRSAPMSSTAWWLTWRNTRGSAMSTKRRAFSTVMWCKSHSSSSCTGDCFLGHSGSEEALVGVPVTLLRCSIGMPHPTSSPASCAFARPSASQASMRAVSTSKAPRPLSSPDVVDCCLTDIEQGKMESSSLALDVTAVSKRTTPVLETPDLLPIRTTSARATPAFTSLRTPAPAQSVKNGSTPSSASECLSVAGTGCHRSRCSPIFVGASGEDITVLMLVIAASTCQVVAGWLVGLKSCAAESLVVGSILDRTETVSCTMLIPVALSHTNAFPAPRLTAAVFCPAASVHDTDGGAPRESSAVPTAVPRMLSTGND